MHEFRIVLAAFAIACCATAAHAQCDLAKFGKHPVPPSPVKAPPVNDQYAQFEWGADAYPADGYWWSLNFIKNDAAAAGLAVTWPKAGISIPTANPLPHGQVTCREKLIGDTTQAVPILDQDAPITYSINNQRQDAVVFVAPVANSSTPGAAPAPANPSPSPTGPVRSGLPSVERFGTTFQQGDKLVPVTVSLESGSIPRDPLASNLVYSLSIHVAPANVTLAIANARKIWTAKQLTAITEGLYKQGFQVDEEPLSKHINRDTFRGLDLSDEAISQPFLFLSNGTNATIRYPSDPDDMPVRKTVYLLMIADYNHPIASEQISLTVPQPR